MPNFLHNRIPFFSTTHIDFFSCSAELFPENNCFHTINKVFISCSSAIEREAICIVTFSHLPASFYAVLPTFLCDIIKLMEYRIIVTRQWCINCINKCFPVEFRTYCCYIIYLLRRYRIDTAEIHYFWDYHEIYPWMDRNHVQYQYHYYQVLFFIYIFKLFCILLFTHNK